ncbi:predicted protein [Sclerotinia sclerotiorum 1980 UF-70]|uniref:Uncharacterized protein n=1 Tax=Sclerotinia sclerotiorum (strain ATCC 18683 / 1980 / Ss-1) TaxID=665079 RepID=A7ETM2_SCLS1|nr:predicted protein [Sclerotinia sclerotiorum 1980 UF-70]EDN92814.1 predicted protein [Sclerotinia sclerotiorum 1980 UF-70]
MVISHSSRLTEYKGAELGFCIIRLQGLVPFCSSSLLFYKLLKRLACLRFPQPNTAQEDDHTFGIWKC